MNYLSIDKLLAFAQNELGGEAEEIRVHLETGCQPCRQRLSQLRKVLSVIETQSLADPPAWLIHQAMNLFTWHTTNSDADRLERIPAFLLVDSFAEGPLLGFRSVGPMPRQMLYRAGNYNINLSMNYAEPTQTIDLMGQSTPLSTDLATVAAADVELLKDSRVACATKANEFGAFMLGGIQEGIYDLRIKLTDEEIDIAGLSAVVRPTLKARRQLTDGGQEDSPMSQLKIERGGQQ